MCNTDSFRYQLSYVLDICLCKNFGDPCVQKLSVDIIKLLCQQKRDAYVICRTNTIQHLLYCYEQFYMKLRGSLLVIVCCLVVEFCDINQKEYLILASGN